MDIPTINDCWMQIGTDNKQQNIETANGRIKSGAKGIGRFALNRLGSKAIMYTHKDGQDAFSWKVNWNDFNAPGKRINEIMADLEVVPLATIQEKMSSVASHFSIELPDFETGTILNIQDLTDVWEVDSLNHLQGALQDLVPPFSMSNFEQYLYVIGVGELGKVDRNFYEDFDYKVSAAYNGDVLNLTIARNELDVNILTTEYKDVFDLEEMQADDYSMASHFSAQNLAFMFGLLESCKLNKVNFGEYIEDILTRILCGEEVDASFLPCDYVRHFEDGTDAEVTKTSQAVA